MDYSDLFQPAINTDKETNLKNLGDLPKALLLINIDWNSGLPATNPVMAPLTRASIFVLLGGIRLARSSLTNENSMEQIWTFAQERY